MNNPSPQSGRRAALLVTVCMLNPFADAQTEVPRSAENANGLTTAQVQQAGELTITDRYGKQTRIDVRVSSAGDANSRAYTSGDRIDADSRVTAVRMGEHIGVVRAGSLWQFPLKPDAFGVADVEFDGVGIVARVGWKVTTASSERTLLEADVLIPVFASGYSPQSARLTGVWKASFDSTFPIPVRSELTARLNVRPAGNESTTTSWVPRQ